jgi:hypothetical protein
MQIDDRPLGLRGGEVEREGKQSNGYQTSGHHSSALFRQVEARSPRKAEHRGRTGGRRETHLDAVPFLRL